MPKGPKGRKRPPTWTATRTLMVIEHVADRAVGVRAHGLAGGMNSGLSIGQESARAPRCSILQRSGTSSRL
jgi:hypothetical protein